MPGLTQRDQRVITRRQVCQNGETIFEVLPQNRLGQVVSMHVDAAYASGLTGPIQLQILDYFSTIDSATAETSGSVTRWQTTIRGGDVGDVTLPEGIHYFGSLRVSSNFSGPIISLGFSHN